MKRMHLDFRRRGRALTGAGVVLLAAGLAAAAYVGTAGRELAGKVRTAEARVAYLEQQGARRAPAARPRDDAALQLEVQNANDILRQLTLPWDALFKAIESSHDKEVALLSVQPDTQRRLLRLTGEAKHFDALLAYVARLEAHAALSAVYITQHELRSDDPDKPVRFALVADWGPADGRPGAP